MAAIRTSPCLSCRIPLRCAHTPLRLTGAYARTHHHPLSLLHDCACAVLYECLSHATCDCACAVLYECLSHATCVHVFVCSCSRVSVGLCPSACVRRLAQGTGGTRFPDSTQILQKQEARLDINARTIHPAELRHVHNHVYCMNIACSSERFGLPRSGIPVLVHSVLCKQRCMDPRGTRSSSNSHPSSALYGVRGKLHQRLRWTEVQRPKAHHHVLATRAMSPPTCALAVAATRGYARLRIATRGYASPSPRGRRRS